MLEQVRDHLIISLILQMRKLSQEKEENHSPAVHLAAVAFPGILYINTLWLT